MPLNVQKAIEAGYPLSDIANVLAQEARFDIASARQRGYTDEDIVNALANRPQPQTGFMPAMRAGFEELKGAAGALGAGLGVEGAEQYAKEKREKAAEIYRQPEFTEAPVSYLTGLLGQSVPFMLAPAAAGAAAFAAVPAGAGALTASLAAGLSAGLASATQFTGTNIQRQLERGVEGKDLEVAKAAAAAIPQAALDTLSLRMVPGLGRIFGKAGIEMTEAELNQVARHGIVSSVADKVKQYGPNMLKTAGTEGLTESAQQVLERAQAGLNIGDEEARKEYFDSFIGGALLGGTLAVPGTAIERGRARQEAEAKRDERLMGERRAEEEKAAAEEAARKASPEYLLGLEPKLNELTAQMKEKQAARGKKPGRGAEPEELEAWQTATTEIKDIGDQIRDLRREVKTRANEIQAAKNEAERQGLTPEQYFIKKMGQEPPPAEATPQDEEAAPSMVELAERKEPEAQAAAAKDKQQRSLDQHIAGLRYFGEAGNPEAVARQIAKDPALAQAFINDEISVSELSKKDARLVKSALPLQLKAREAERAARTAEVVGKEKEALERIAKNIKSVEDFRKQLDAERYALRNMAQDPSNPVGINEKIDKIIKLLEDKAKPAVETEAGYGAGALKGRRTAGAVERAVREPLLKFNEETGEYEEVKREADAFNLTKEADSELIRLLEKFRLMQQQKGAARDSAAMADLLEEIRLAAEPKRTEVLKDYVNTVPDILQTGFGEKERAKSSYMAEIDRLAGEQEEAFPAALEAIRVNRAFKLKPEAPPLKGTLTAKPKSQEERVTEEAARLDAEEKKARGRFTTAVLQEIEANRRADENPSLTKDEANLIAGRINNTLTTAASRKFGAPEEAQAVIKEDIGKLIEQYSETEKKTAPRRVELVGPRAPAPAVETEAAAPEEEITTTAAAKKEKEKVVRKRKHEGISAKRSLDIVNAHIDAMGAKLNTLVLAVRRARAIAERSGKASPGYKKIEADINRRMDEFAKDQQNIQQYYDTLKQYRAQQDQSGAALVRVYDSLDRQKRRLEQKREALKTDSAPARAAMRRYNQAITEIDRELDDVRTGFEASGADVDNAVKAFEKKIAGILQFKEALSDNAAIARQPALSYLRDYVSRNKPVQKALEEATSLRGVFDSLQQQKREFLSKMAGARRAATAIAAGAGKTPAQRVKESQAEAARQQGLGLPGTRVERADIKSQIVKLEEMVEAEKDSIARMEERREDARGPDKTALTRQIKKAENKTIPELERQIDELQAEAKASKAPTTPAKPERKNVLPAKMQEKAKAAFEKKFGEFKLAGEIEEGEIPTMAYRRVTPPKFKTAGMETGVGAVRRAGKREMARVERELDAPDTDAVFRVGDENTTQVDAAEARALADKIKAGLPEDVKVLYIDKFDNIDDFNKVPGKFITALGKHGLMERNEDGTISARRVKGAVLGDGTVVVIGSHHATLAELEGTFAHELHGHYGIDMLLGEKGFKKLIKAVEKEHGSIMELAAKFGIEDEVADAARYYAELYQEMKKAGAPREKLDMAYDKGQIQAMRELIAHIEEARVDQTLLQKAGTFIKEMIGAVRAGLRKLGLFDMAEASTSDLYYMLRKSRKSFNQRQMGAYVSPTKDIVFSRKPAFSGQVDASIADTVNKVVKGPTSVADRIKSEATGIAARTAFVDRLAPMERVAEGLKKSAQAMQMLYYGRMYDQRMAWTGATVNGGAPKLEQDEKGNRIIKSRGGANLKDIADKLGQVKNMGNAEAVRDLFTTYLAAHRAENKGINKLNFTGAVSPAELRKVKNLGDSIPQFAEARKLYNEYNNGLINWLAESGAIDKRVADELLKDQDYVPFYRAVGDNVVMEIAGSQTITIGNLQNQPYLKDLIGGDQKIQDFFTSSLQNTAMIVDMGLRNLATKEAAFSLQEAGLLKPLGKYKGKETFIGDGHGPSQPNTLRFKKDGKDKFVVVESEDSGIPSELLVKGLHGVTTTIGGFTKVLAMPARFLRAMVTRNPVYAARQVVRDSASNFLLAGGDMTPVASAANELLKMASGTSKGEQELQKRGVIGGQLLTGTPEDMQKIMLQLTKGGSGWEAALAKLDRMHMKADAAARVTLYNDYRKQGLSDMEATLATLESMNFSKRGTSGSLYALNMMVPFLNAQIQGLNVLYQAFTGKLPYADKLKVQRKLITRGMMLAAGTLAYAAAMQDDEIYKNASLRDRLQNWFVPVPGVDEPVKVPIPFEVGLIFKALPEAIALSMSKDEDAERVLAALGGLVAMSSPVGISTFVPQAAKPLVEATTNYQFYNGAPVESKREQELMPSERTRDKTSGVAKLISEMISGVAEGAGYPTKGISPVMVDSLINGYTGGLGLAIAQMVGTLVPTGETPPSAEKRMSDLPVVGSLFQPVDASGQITQFYEKATEYGQIKQTFDKMLNEGRADDAQAFAEKYGRQIALADVAEDFKQTMSEFTDVERTVRADMQMSPVEKRRTLDELRQAKIEFAKAFHAASRQQ